MQRRKVLQWICRSQPSDVTLPLCRPAKVTKRIIIIVVIIIKVFNNRLLDVSKALFELVKVITIAVAVAVGVKRRDNVKIGKIVYLSA